MQSKDHWGLSCVAEKTRPHRSYKHYTLLDRAIKKLDTQTLYLSDGSNWNDKLDAHRFNVPNNPNKCFGMSFSWLSSENVAMWMLYGGISVPGALIDFPSHFPKVIQSSVSRIEFGCFDAGAFKSVEEHSLEEGVSLGFVDVAYTAQTVSEGPEDTIGLKIRLEAPFKMPIEYLYTDEYSLYCVKSAPWFYETEARLVVTVPKSLLAHEVEAARICVPNLLELLEGRLYLSPEVTWSESHDLRFRESRLTGELSWDLCNGCPGAAMTRRER